MATKTPIVPDKILQAGDEIEVNVKGSDGKVRLGKAKIKERIEVYNLTDENIVTGIATKQIIATPNTVSKIGEKNTDTVYLVYTELEATDAESMALLAGGKVNLETQENDKGQLEAKPRERSVASFYNSGLSMDAKRRLRMLWDKKNEDPAKILERAINSLAILPGWTREKAEAMVKAQMEEASRETATA